MGIFTKSVISFIFPAVCIGAFQVSAENVTSDCAFSDYAYKAASVSSPFETARMKAIRRTNDILDGKENARRDVRVSQPVLSTLGPSETIEDIDTPWGEIWFYTGSFKYSYIKVSDDYNRPILEEYEFKIYDSQMNLKGVVRDKMEYQVYYDAPRDPATASPTEKE